jgi:hypothetical protein
MKTINICLLLVITASFVAACKKNSTPLQLPAISHTGHNMIAYKVNGNIISLYPSFTSDISFYPYGSGLTEITANTTAPPVCGITFNFQYFDSLGHYPISSFSNYPYGGTFTDNSNGSLTGTKYNSTYFTDSIHSGIINVIFYNGTEMAGYFQFDAVNDSGVVILITEGRFDLYKG